MILERDRRVIEKMVEAVFKFHGWDWDDPCNQTLKEVTREEQTFVLLSIRDKVTVKVN